MDATTPVDDQEVMVANTGPRPAARDRLRKRTVKIETVDLGDDLIVEVRGLNAAAAMEMGKQFEDVDEVDAAEANAALLRATCWDPELKERLYDDSWTIEDINNQPIDVVNQLVTAANRVLGRTTEPGKD